MCSRRKGWRMTGYNKPAAFFGLLFVVIVLNMLMFGKEDEMIEEEVDAEDPDASGKATAEQRSKVDVCTATFEAQFSHTCSGAVCSCRVHFCSTTADPAMIARIVDTAQTQIISPSRLWECGKIATQRTGVALFQHTYCLDFRLPIPTGGSKSSKVLYQVSLHEEYSSRKAELADYVSDVPHDFYTGAPLKGSPFTFEAVLPLVGDHISSSKNSNDQLWCIAGAGSNGYWSNTGPKAIKKYTHAKSEPFGCAPFYMPDIFKAVMVRSVYLIFCTFNQINRKPGR
jgi:hypothetical protein